MMQVWEELEKTRKVKHTLEREVARLSHAEAEKEFLRHRTEELEEEKKVAQL